VSPFARQRDVSLSVEDTSATPQDYAKAILNILADFGEEKDRQADTQKAILNVLDDFGEEKDRLEGTQKAMLNLLDDFGGEKTRLEATQRAMLNLLDDFDAEKSKVEGANVDLRREIADRLQTERELVEKTAALARSNAELEQFAYVASHDLQEPLRMVSSYVQLFEKRYHGHVDEQADKYIRYAVEGAKRMQALIGGLLEYSRIGRQEEAPETVDTGAALAQALSNLRSALEESRAVVTQDPLPTVVGNGGQIAQVFQNLVSNAIKFRRAEYAPRVHVSAAPHDGVWRFSVRDNGIGIDGQYADRVFVIFQRLHTRAEYPGTGIGLSICKKVIERHGGRIWIESPRGEDGTTFFFTLPRVATKAAE
jgi:light-regulated signal transduction histidine kinase (bacteriophytochrome)